MKIKQLIDELKKYNENSEVITEGCDCNGDVGSVEEMGDDVYLKRSSL